MEDKQVNLSIKATNASLTPDVRALVESKFQPLAKFLKPHRGGEIRISAEVGRRNKADSKSDDTFFAELDIVSGGERHRAVAAAPDLREAIDQVKKEMTAHLSRQHERGKEAFQRGARAMKEALQADLAPADEIEAMIEEEAAEIAAVSPTLPPLPTRRLEVISSGAGARAKAAPRKPKAVARKAAKKKPARKAPPVARKAKAKKLAAKKAKGPAHGKKNTRGAKNRPPVKRSPRR